MAPLCFCPVEVIVTSDRAVFTSSSSSFLVPGSFIEVRLSRKALKEWVLPCISLLREVHSVVIPNAGYYRALERTHRLPFITAVFKY